MKKLANISMFESLTGSYSGAKSDLSVFNEAPVVFYSIGTDKPITPGDALPGIPYIPDGALVVIEGRAPVWRYGAALDQLRSCGAAAVATFDPRLGAVVVSSYSPEYKVGQIVDVDPAA